MAVLAHELGHAAVGLTRTKGLVRVRVGRSLGVWRVRLGRLSLELHPFPARNEPEGLARTHAHFGQTSALLYTLAGPAAGCLAALLLVLGGIRAGFEPLAVIGGLVFFSELSNLLPSDHHGIGSDGTRAARAMSNKTSGKGSESTRGRGNTVARACHGCQRDTRRPWWRPPLEGVARTRPRSERSQQQGSRRPRQDRFLRLVLARSGAARHSANSRRGSRRAAPCCDQRRGPSRHRGHDGRRAREECGSRGCVSDS